MYHVFYPDPLNRPRRGEPEQCLREEAETLEEAVELGERAAARWRGIERCEVMIFSGDGCQELPGDDGGNRCPECGCTVDVTKFDLSNVTDDDYDHSYGAYKLRMECPECGETVYAWFYGDPEDGLEFHEIDEYGEPPVKAEQMGCPDGSDPDYRLQDGPDDPEYDSEEYDGCDEEEE